MRSYVFPSVMRDNGVEVSNPYRRGTDTPDRPVRAYVAPALAHPLWHRLPAALIDLTLCVAVLMPLVVPLLVSVIDRQSGEIASPILRLLHGLNEFAAMRMPASDPLRWLLPGILLLIQLSLLYQLGATIGKWLLRIRIVGRDESAAGFVRLLVLRYLLPLVLYALPYFGLVILLLDLLLIFQSSRQTLHDILAGTQVVRVFAENEVDETAA